MLALVSLTFKSGSVWLLRGELESTTLSLLGFQLLQVSLSYITLFRLKADKLYGLGQRL